MLRAEASTGTRAGITIAEMMPTPEHAWVPDGAGRRYFGEFRLQITDAAAAHG